MKALDKFKEKIGDGSGLIVLEYGTKRWGKDPTHHKSLWPKATHYGVDFIDGEDVDMVCDVHEMSQHARNIDVIFSASTFEHLKKPWIAADEILKTLKPGGFFFIQTHSTFPIHAYPDDYYRFSDEALKSLFTDAVNVIVNYDFPCKIVPAQEIKVWDHGHRAYLNVCIYGERKA